MVLNNTERHSPWFCPARRFIRKDFPVRYSPATATTTTGWEIWSRIFSAFGFTVSWLFWFSTRQMGSIMVDPDSMGSCNPEERLSKTQDPQVISHDAHQASAFGTYTSIFYVLYASKRWVFSLMCQGLYRYIMYIILLILTWTLK